MKNKNWYSILGVSQTANFKEIKSAYRHLAKQFHPDKNQDNTSAEERFKEVQHAYMILSDPEKRKKYDLRSSGSGAAYTKPKQYGRYNGNAYQYAQQQTRKKQQAQEQQEDYEPSQTYRTEINQILISFIIALILLYFIVSF